MLAQNFISGLDGRCIWKRKAGQWAYEIVEVIKKSIPLNECENRILSDTGILIFDVMQLLHLYSVRDFVACGDLSNTDCNL